MKQGYFRCIADQWTDLLTQQLLECPAVPLIPNLPRLYKWSLAEKCQC